MTKYLEIVNGIVWGVPALVLILGVGLYLSIRTRFAQLILFPVALRRFFQMLRGGGGKEGISPFQALCTALAATVGTGNLAGVAGAIAIGGPGAIFWMWICALLGMITKFAEATLAVRYRVLDNSGNFTGGPMYMIQKGLGNRWSWLGSVYCFFGVVAAFGVGNATQINAVVGSVNSVFAFFGIAGSRTGNAAMGLLLGITVTVMLLGGARRIGVVAERLVPFASVAYLLLGLGVLTVNIGEIPGAFASIVQGAFSPRAATGGVLGSAFLSLRTGVSRGVFTNEAGMGTASIAHASAQVEHPAEQGLMGIIEVFLDTIVICTMTALVILCSGVPVPYGNDEGVVLTTRAFASVYGKWISIPIALSICCFAFATVLGWGLYGARCAQYLFGENAWKPFALLQGGTVVLGAVLNTGTVWMLSETVNGLMAIPNLIALAGLSSELVRLTEEYKQSIRKPGSAAATGGTYEHIHQCQPLRAVSYAEISSTGRQGGEKRKKNLSFEHRPA